jgi:hypothetical protein
MWLPAQLILILANAFFKAILHKMVERYHSAKTPCIFFLRNVILSTIQL